MSILKVSKKKDKFETVQLKNCQTRTSQFESNPIEIMPN